MNGFYRGQEDEVLSREDMVTEPLSEIRLGLVKKGEERFICPG